MRPQITKAGTPLSPAMLARAEARLGFKLPGNYIAFLRVSNGGRPIPDIVPTSSFPGSAATDLRQFYSIDATLDCYDLVKGYEVWLRDSPANLLPIACDSGGSVFCLSVRSDDIGKVYYWDWHREQHPVRTRYPWIYPIADSLEEFLDSFRELLPEECSPAEANPFVWRTDWITAEIRRDDAFLKIGQYLHLSQRLPPGESGWTTNKIEIPESWLVQDVEVASGAVTLTTGDGRVFQLTRENVTKLDFAILDGNPKSDEELERIWEEHALVQTKRPDG